MNCLACGKAFKTTEKRNICDECYEFNFSLHLFHGEDIVANFVDKYVQRAFGQQGL